jgi:hypothetical protein
MYIQRCRQVSRVICQYIYFRFALQAELVDTDNIVVLDFLILAPIDYAKAL